MLTAVVFFAPFFALPVFAEQASQCSENRATLEQLVDQLYLASKDYPKDEEGFLKTIFLRDQVLENEPQYEIFSAGESRKTSMDRFLGWAKEHYSMDGIEITWNDKFGARMIASRDLDTDEELIRVPSEKTINTVDIAKKYECLADVKQDWNIYYLTWYSKTIMVELLAQAIRNDSFFKPYIQTFPREYVMPTQ